MDKRSTAIREKIDAIEAEMQRLGMWDVEKPAPEAFKNMGAFGLQTMAFVQWLRYVFVPRVRETLETNGPWPGSSMVAAQAVREFDGYHEASQLVSLLSEFDRLF